MRKEYIWLQRKIRYEKTLFPLTIIIFIINDRNCLDLCMVTKNWFLRNDGTEWLQIERHILLWNIVCNFIFCKSYLCVIANLQAYLYGFFVHLYIADLLTVYKIINIAIKLLYLYTYIFI